MTIGSQVNNMIGREVVVDTRSSYVYLGTLSDFNEDFLTLAGVDVHEMTDSHCTKELYIMEARRLGIRPNRESVKVMTRDVISISPLSDVRVFE